MIRWIKRRAGLRASWYTKGQYNKNRFARANLESIEGYLNFLNHVQEADNKKDKDGKGQG